MIAGFPANKSDTPLGSVSSRVDDGARGAKRRCWIGDRRRSTSQDIVGLANVAASEAVGPPDPVRRRGRVEGPKPKMENLVS